MRVVIQRVLSASVHVAGTSVANIQRGLCVLVGISRTDTQQDADYMMRKILNLRLFDDTQQRSWTKSVMDVNGDVLLVSQFTLYGISKGNKPDFHEAMEAKLSEPFFSSFVASCRQHYSTRSDAIQTGEFGANMQVSLVNDGPVTITLDTAGMQFPPLKDKSKWEAKNAANQEKQKQQKHTKTTDTNSQQTTTSTTTSTDAVTNTSNGISSSPTPTSTETSTSSSSS